MTTLPGDFVERVNANGDKQLIPRAWSEPGHRFADQFRQSPSQRQREERTVDPSMNWTEKQLRAHAESAQIDLAGVTTKADIVAAINTPPRGDAERK